MVVCFWTRRSLHRKRRKGCKLISSSEAAAIQILALLALDSLKIPPFIYAYAHWQLFWNMIYIYTVPHFLADVYVFRDVCISYRTYSRVESRARFLESSRGWIKQRTSRAAFAKVTYWHMCSMCFSSRVVFHRAEWKTVNTFNVARDTGILQPARTSPSSPPARWWSLDFKWF